MGHRITSHRHGDVIDSLVLCEIFDGHTHLMGLRICFCAAESLIDGRIQRTPWPYPEDTLAPPNGHILAPPSRHIGSTQMTHWPHVLGQTN